MTAVAGHCTDFISDALHYTVTDEAAMTVCADSLVDREITDLTIPETVENEGKTYTVTAVRVYMASSQQMSGTYYCAVTNVVIPKTVTDIIRIGQKEGEGYNPSNIRRTITFAEGSQLKTIHDRAFYQLGAGTLSLPPSVEAIGDEAFYEAKITSVKIPEKIKKINKNIFSGISSISHIDLGNIEEIDDSAFCGLSTLTDVSMEKVKHIGYRAFYGCDRLRPNLPETLESVYGEAFTMKFGQLSLPASVDTIGNYAFNANEIYPQGAVPARLAPGAFYTNSPANTVKPVVKVDISLFKTYFEAPMWKDYPVSITPFEVGTVRYSVVGMSYDDSGAFMRGQVHVQQAWQKEDETVVIPATIECCGLTFAVTGIDNYSLSNVYNLEVNAPVETLGKQGRGIWNVRSIKLPPTLKRIEDQTFYFSSLTEIDLPESLEYIGNSAFAICQGLESVNIPASVKTIGENAFQYCIYITTATMSAEEIGAGAFSNCRMLETLTLNEGVKKIGKEIISGTERLKELYLPASVEQIGYVNAYTTGYTDTVMLICRDSRCEAIRVSEANPYYKDIDGVLFNKAGTSLLQYPCGRTVSHYDVPAGVSVIGAYAFSHCMGLNSVKLPEGLRSIRDSAFDLTGLSSTVTLPESLDSLGNNSFRESSSVPSSFPVLQLNSPVPPKVRVSRELENTELNEAYLDKNAPLKEVRYVCVPAEAYEAYKSDKFWGRFNLVTEVKNTDGNFIFEPTADGKAELVGCYKALEGCVTVPATAGIDGSDRTVAIIGKRAFYNNSAITEVILPETVEEIADSAFYGCSSLQTINVLQNPAEAAQNATRAPYRTAAQTTALRRVGTKALYGVAIKSLYIPEHAMLTLPGCIRTDSLQKIEVDVLNPYYSAKDGVLYNAAMDSMLIWPSAKKSVSFILPETVKTISGGVFISLTGSYFPSYVYVFAPVPPENNGGFSTGFSTLYVRESSLEAYQNAPCWENYGKIVGMSDDEIEQFITGIDGVRAGTGGKAAHGDVYHTLGGVRVKVPAKGIYIHNGRKVVNR